MDKNTAIVLFAHGARDPQWAEPFRELQSRIAAASGCRVELAFLELMEPSLANCIAHCVKDGANNITLVPLFMAQGGHLKEDLPRLLEEIRSRHAGVEIRLASAIGEVEEILAAISAWVCRVAKENS
jgi:sirohydrochlorin cobaltochelatase